MMEPAFMGGINFVLKIPKSKYAKTLDFYKNILKFDVREVPIQHPAVSRSHQAAFGKNTIWQDCVDHCTHAEVWPEIRIPDVKKATEHLSAHAVETCDELEEIPENSHWIQDPAGTVFVLNQIR